MRSVRGIKEKTEKKTHTDWKTDLNQRDRIGPRIIVFGSDGEI